jgi:hypothetical protein
MALTSLLYVPFHRAYSSRDVLKWLEYVSLSVPCNVRIPQWAPLYGTLQGKHTTLEFTCCSPAGGPVTGFAFRTANGTGKRARRAENELLRKIHRATRQYDKIYRQNGG